MKRRTFWAERIFRVLLALLPLGLTAQTDIGEPFGLATAVAPEGPLWATWTDLELKTKAEQVLIPQCRVDPHSCSSSAALRFLAIVNDGKQYEGIARIGHINRAVNFAIRGTRYLKNGHRRWLHSNEATEIANSTRC